MWAWNSRPKFDPKPNFGRKFFNFLNHTMLELNYELMETYEFSTSEFRDVYPRWFNVNFIENSLVRQYRTDRAKIINQKNNCHQV